MNAPVKVKIPQPGPLNTLEQLADYLRTLADEGLLFAVFRCRQEYADQALPPQGNGFEGTVFESIGDCHVNGPGVQLECEGWLEPVVRVVAQRCKVCGRQPGEVHTYNCNKRD